jgi:hypothetical protein
MINFSVLEANRFFQTNFIQRYCAFLWTIKVFFCER